jgi:hypothetical protein
MKTNEFILKLRAHLGKALLFEYSEGKYAETNYHLTEVKNVTFETVDCGGKKNQWKETQLQLWESPSEQGKTDYMTVDKVISILERVDGINPLWLDTDIKVEFGNEQFHTSILDIMDFSSSDDKLIVKLFTVKTGCKANDVCGEVVEEKSTSCCGTVSNCC